MKKLSFTAGVAAIALALTTIFPAAGVFAATVNTNDYTGNPVTLKRTVTNVTNPVTNTFGYTITNTAKPDGANVSNAPSTASIAFSNAAPTGGSVQATTTVNFSAANYSKVGDYEFTITEDSSTDASNYPIDTASNDYTAIVQVRYYVNPSTNVPDNSRYVATIYLKDSSNAKDSDGIATWTSGSTYTYIQATATTTGNLGETDECFAYEISIPNSGVTAGGAYAIDINPTSGACTGSATTVAAGSPATVYLKHGDTVRVGYNGGAYQLPVGASYTITDTNDDEDGYITKMDGDTRDSVSKTTAATDDSTCGDDNGCFSQDNTTAIENNKNQNPLTGIVTNFWFYIMLLVAGIVGFFIISRRKRDDEEQQQA